MTRLPPVWVRRVLIAPLAVAAGPLLLGFTPLLLLAIAIVATLIPRRFRWPRAFLTVLVYMIWDSVLLVVLFVLWIASGFGWKVRSPAFIRAHYRVAAVALRLLFAVCRGVLRLRISTEASDDSLDLGAAASFADVLQPGVPVIVASRHAGPGDSFILMQALLNDVRRMPRVVVKDTMQWDPAIDVLLHRLPAGFITPTGFGHPASAPRSGPATPAATAVIAELARGLGPEDAFVIFPEGGNFTESRRAARIQRLLDGSDPSLAVRAEALIHVLAPQPGGLRAALDAADDADVVFIAHSGLDELATVKDVWRALPMDKRIILHAWRVSRTDVPSDRAAQLLWLYGWFARIDAWIDGRGQGNPPQR